MENFGFFTNGAFDVAACALYLCDLLAKGVFSGVGKDLWEEIKMKPAKKIEKSVIQKVENENSLANKDDNLQFILEDWMQEDLQFRENILKILAEQKPIKASGIELGVGNKNVVIKSNLSNNSGNIHIGDNDIS